MLKSILRTSKIFNKSYSNVKMRSKLQLTS